MRWSQRVAGALVGASLGWALWHYGATETWALYGLFLMLLVPALISCFCWPKAAWTPELGLFFVAGIVLLARMALMPSLEAEGYTLLAVGWLALFSTWTIAASSVNLASHLALVLVLVAGGEALLGLLQASGLGVAETRELRDQLGATGTFINRNHFAALLNMALPLAFGALVAGWGRRQRLKAPRSETLAWAWLTILGCSLLGLAVLLSRSRGGILALAATLLFLAVVVSRDRAGANGKALPGIAAGLLLALVLGLGLALGPKTFIERFAQIGESGQGRLTLYRDTLGLVADHAILGVGPGMYGWHFRSYQSEDFSHRYDHAHNDYLESAAEWGLPVALLFWAWVFRRLFRALRLFRVSRTPSRRGTALGAAGAIAATLLHSLVDFNLQIAADWMYFCAVLGLAWGLEIAPGRRPRRSSP